MKLNYSVKGATCSIIKTDKEIRIFNIKSADKDSEVRLLEFLSLDFPDHLKLGPIGESTWEDYRVVTWSDGSQPFPGETVSASWRDAAWLEAGFEVMERYSSYVDIDPKRRDLKKNMKSLKIEVWDKVKSVDLLKRVHELSEVAFAKAPYFLSIPEAVFVERFSHALSGDAGKMSFAAFDGDEIVGFVFGYPDGKGGFVLKTLVSIKPGVGAYLVDKFYDKAISSGARYIIHALMRDDNISTNMSKKFNTQVMREYAVYGKGSA